MKVLAFILSSYLLFLITTPCCAFDSCPTDKMAQNENHEKGDDDCGTCSPFFTCTGCASFTLSIDYLIYNITPHFTGRSYSGYILSTIPDMHYDFWQPPKNA